MKVRLRQLGQPITLFGEDKGTRRERLHNQVIDFYLLYKESPDETIFQDYLKDWSNVSNNRDEIEKAKDELRQNFV